MITLKKNTQDKQFWQVHISQWRASNLTQAAYCRHHGLSQDNFGYHKRKKSVALVPVKSSGFINLSLPQVNPVDKPLTLHLSNGMLLSGITPDNINLIKQLTGALS
jgi:hypothetical protein